MSKYSGECDIYDCYGDYTDDQLLNMKFYRGWDDVVPLRINNQKDLCPFYGHTVSLSNGETVFISYTSVCDRMEEDQLNRLLETIQREYRKRKRNKIEFKVSDEEIIEWATKNIFFHDESDKELVIRLWNKVYDGQGVACTLGFVKGGMIEYYRKTLENKMKEFGYSDSEIRKWIRHTL